MKATFRGGVHPAHGSKAQTQTTPAPTQSAQTQTYPQLVKSGDTVKADLNGDGTA